jgi:hypothetical protein
MSIQFEMPNPYGTEDLQSAYAWIVLSSADFTSWSSRLVLGVNKDAAAAQAGKPFLKTYEFTGGQVLVQAVYGNEGEVITPAVTYPTLQEKLQDPEYAAAFATIRAKEYEWAKLHPDLAEGIDVA